MKIHALVTGKVRVTESWREGRGAGPMRLVHTLTDRHFTDWLPIYSWVVEHPEGLMVIDTGIPTNANAPVYFPPYYPLVRRAAPFDIQPEQEIGPQMRRLGLSTNDVRWVVLTHLHQDHAGGMQYFPQAEFIISRTEWQAAQGIAGQLAGYLNWRWPDWLKPTQVDFDRAPYGPFPSSVTLTQAGDVRLLPTPGHSAGHLSAVVQEEAQAIFIAGDASYSQALLLADSVDGVGVDPQAERRSHAQIMAYAAQQPLVYLPSHDPDAARRLAEREVLIVNEAVEEKAS